MAAGITSDNFKQSTDVLLNVLIDQKLVFFKILLFNHNLCFDVEYDQEVCILDYIYIF